MERIRPLSLTLVYNGMHICSGYHTVTGTSYYRDAPNAWPPHQYIALEALRALPLNITSNPIPKPSSGQSTFSLIPSGQLGLTEEQLPSQILRGTQNATKTGSAADINAQPSSFSVINGGNGTRGEGWAHALERELANRYMTSALCSW